MNVEKTELLNCPFCGGEAIINTIEPHTHIIDKVAQFMPDYNGGTFIECTKCTAALSGDTEAEAISAWNTRAEAQAEPRALICSGCVHQGLYENEIEYGYNSPCTNCKRRCFDNYSTERPPTPEAERKLFGPCHGCIYGDDRFDNPCSCPVPCENYNQYQAERKGGEKI